MELGQLRYFQKIVEHRSFTKAAAACDVSQPALSQQIAKLEKEFGQPLFERQGRTIQLTAAGHVLQNQSEKILRLADDVKKQITDDGETGQIRLSAIPTVAPYLLPEILAKIGPQFPNATFSISEDTTDVLLKRCSVGDVDVGLVALPASGKYLKVESLFTEELLLGLSVDHPLANRKRLSVNDIRDEPFVLLGDTHCLVDAIERFCHRRSFQPLTTSRIEQMTTVQHLISLGQGVSFVPKMATGCNPDGRVVYRSVTGEKPTRKIAMCWNENRYQSQLLTNFIKALRELLGNGFHPAGVPQAGPSSRKRERTRTRL